MENNTSETKTETTNTTPVSNPAPTSSTQSANTATGPSKNTLMGILSYIGPLVLIPYFTVAKDDTFARFHVRQGLVLLVIEVAVWVLGMAWYTLWPLYSIINLATLILSIIGIVHAAKGEEKELPVVGKYSSHFKL